MSKCLSLLGPSFLGSSHRQEGRSFKSYSEFRDSPEGQMQQPPQPQRLYSRELTGSSGPSPYLSMPRSPHLPRPKGSLEPPHAVLGQGDGKGGALSLLGLRSEGSPPRHPTHRLSHSPSGSPIQGSFIQVIPRAPSHTLPQRPQSGSH